MRKKSLTCLASLLALALCLGLLPTAAWAAGDEHSHPVAAAREAARTLTMEVAMPRLSGREQTPCPLQRATTT